MHYMIYYLKQLEYWSFVYRREYMDHVLKFKSWSSWKDRSVQLKMIKPVWSWSDFFQCWRSS